MMTVEETNKPAQHKHSLALAVGELLQPHAARAAGALARGLWTGRGRGSEEATLALVVGLPVGQLALARAVQRPLALCAARQRAAARRQPQAPTAGRLHRGVARAVERRGALTALSGRTVYWTRWASGSHLMGLAVTRASGTQTEGSVRRTTRPGGSAVAATRRLLRVPALLLSSSSSSTRTSGHAVCTLAYMLAREAVSAAAHSLAVPALASPPAHAGLAPPVASDMKSLGVWPDGAGAGVSAHLLRPSFLYRPRTLPPSTADLRRFFQPVPRHALCPLRAQQAAPMTDRAAARSATRVEQPCSSVLHRTSPSSQPTRLTFTSRLARVRPSFSLLAGQPVPPPPVSDP